MTAAAFSELLATHGLWLMAPLALVEGPLVTVAAGTLAAQGVLPLGGVILTATAADLCGDVLLWLSGRHLCRQLPFRLKRRIVRRVPFADLRRNAGRVLLFGKLTHSLGAAVLLASGMARVPFMPFVTINLLATVPKVCAFALLGWAFGHTLTGNDRLFAPLGFLTLAATAGIAALWLRKKGKSNARLLPYPSP